ncbi:MAG: NAD(P)/FAD-dependent oxidoreductase [Nitrospirota bacterium]
MTVKQKYDLIIIGGGGGGLLLALILGRLGIKIALLERQKTPTFFRGGEMIQPSALRTLDRFGLLPDLLSRDVFKNRFVHFKKTNGDPLCTIDYQQIRGTHAYSLILRPEVIQTLLIEKVREIPEVTLFCGENFTTILREGSQVIGIETDDGVRTKQWFAPIVVAADGPGSQFRSAMGVSSDLSTYRDGYLTALLPLAAGFQEQSCYYLGRREIAGFFPVGKETLYLFYMVQKNKLNEILKRPFEWFLQELRAVNLTGVPAFEQAVFSKLTGWSDLSFRPCFRVRCESWAENGAVLLGDAAHAMNPHVAQGRNSAMEDAVVLSDIVLDCFRKGDFSKKTLSEYEALRRPSVEVLQRLGDEMTFFWNSGLAPVIWARNMSFRALANNRALRDKMLKTISGVEVTPTTWQDRLKMMLSGL